MIIDSERRIGFVHVPKAAGTSVMSWIESSAKTRTAITRIGGWVNGVDTMHGNWESVRATIAEIERKKQSPIVDTGAQDSKTADGKTPDNTPASAAVKTSGSFGESDYFTFAVVRHPYERVCSAYLEMKLNGGWASVWGRIPFADVNQLIDHLAAHPAEIYSDKYIHLRPAHWFTHTKDDRPAVSLIGKMESLEESLKPVAERFGITQKLEHRNRRLNGRGRDAMSLLTDSSCQKLDKLYQKDYLIFGYGPRKSYKSAVPDPRPPLMRRDLKPMRRRPRPRSPQPNHPVSTQQAPQQAPQQAVVAAPSTKG